MFKWCQGKTEDAFTFYNFRLKLTGWIEETFIAAFRLGRITKKLSEFNREFS